MPAGNGRTVLIGPLVKKDTLRKEVQPRDTVIAVDGGLHVAHQAKIPVDLALGDWDSLKERFPSSQSDSQLESLLGQYPHLRFPTDKDCSDFLLGLEQAKRTQANHLVLLGCIGGRMDHQLALFQDLAQFLRRPSQRQRWKSILIKGENEEIRILTDRMSSFRKRMRKGKSISVIPFYSARNEVSLKGVRYPLRRKSLPMGSTGLSNVTSGGEVMVRVHSGQVMVIQNHEI